MGKAESLLKARAKYLLDNFKLTPEEWDKIAAYQLYVCWVCGLPNASNKRLSTDHDHDNEGEVRGLLCSRCNPLLGKLENAFKRYGLHKLPGITLIGILKGLLRYLESPPARAALGRIHLGYKGRIGTKAHRKLLKKLAKVAPHTAPLLHSKKGKK
jgi:hypothetical protein